VFDPCLASIGPVFTGVWPGSDQYLTGVDRCLTSV
jgi:hypothetical protein